MIKKEEQLPPQNAAHRKSWRYWLMLAGSFLFLVILIVALVPTPRMRYVYLDITNGRHHIHETIFGVTLRDEIVDTDFSKLVAQHNLEGDPEWVSVVLNGLGLSGEFRMCGYQQKGHLYGSYRSFASDVFPLSSLDDPTTSILEIRRLAKIDDGRLVEDVLTSITNQSDWPARTKKET